MQNAFVGGRFYAGGNLPEQRISSLHRDSPLGPKQFVERIAIDELHDQKEDPFNAFTEISYVDNVGMLNRGRRAGFAFEGSHGFAFLQVIGRKYVWPERLD